MRTARSSAPCVADFRSAVRAALLALALLLPPHLQAQQPVLRLSGAPAPTVQGTVVDGAPVFPARALEHLGFRLAAAPGSLTAVIGSDTLRFWATSPYFRAGARVQQLAFAVHAAADGTHLPEQFFIRWLPSAWPDRFEFRGGALVVKGGAPAVAQPAAQPVARTGSQQRATPQADAARPPAAAGQSAAATAGGPARQGGASRAAARDRIVIIDPGHGGRDPGKIGPNGVQEKQVTLAISQRLATILRDRGYEVHLTRTADTLISLADRPRIANRLRADRPGAVFLSIHANSAPSTTARGFETFFLSEARTEDERRVAEAENAAVRFEDQPVVPTDDGLDRILYNLRSDFLTRASHDLAAVMQEKMATVHPGPNRGVKRAGFYVLVGAIMPAVLIETAFLSNRAEADLLGTRDFQQKIAWGIADGVDEFFKRHEHLWAQEP